MAGAGKQAAPVAEPYGHAAPAPRQPAAALTRREAIRAAMFGGVGLCFAQAATGLGVMFWPMHVHGFGALVPAGKVSDIAVGDVVKFPQGRFYITRPDAGHIIALYWKCAHLGCTVPWVPAEGQFHCPCHMSTYDIYGRNTGGPAPRPLDYMQVSVRDGEITVNTAKIFKRLAFNPSQLTPV